MYTNQDGIKIWWKKYGKHIYKTICNSCEKNENKYTIDNYVIPFWIDEFGKKTYKYSKRTHDVYQRMFKVRRLIVLTALKWLWRYNYNYRQLKIVICEKNLDWMTGKAEALLPVNNSIDT